MCLSIHASFAFAVELHLGFFFIQLEIFWMDDLHVARLSLFLYPSTPSPFRYALAGVVGGTVVEEHGNSFQVEFTVQVP